MADMTRTLDPRDPYFRPANGKRVGTFVVTNTGRWFHQSVTCSKITQSPDLYEVDILYNHGDFYRAGSLVAVEPCPSCDPFGEKPTTVADLDTSKAVCLGQSDRWVRSHRNRKPDSIIPEQRECMNCPILDECYQVFLTELPVYGVLGGVTMLQYKTWGDDALEVVKELIASEDQEEEHTTRATQHRSTGRRRDRSTKRMERAAG